MPSAAERPLISVIVPFHNNEGDLAACLASIAAQSYDQLEIIMVDDGSTDGGAAIAGAVAAADPRFRLIQFTDGGSPGFSRNRGVEAAAGEYLAFVDGDDVLAANAYDLMLDSLRRSGSDLVSGQVDRIGPKGINQSVLHAIAIKGRQQGTHVAKTPRLLYDVSVWNKLFRKSFWDQHGLRFPEGVVWEDIQLITQAHVLAKKVDVIPEVVYYWRERVGGGGSITQRRTDIANLRDRVNAMLTIDRFIAGYGPAKLLGQHQYKALKNDLWLYVADMNKVSQEYRAEFCLLLAQYLAQVPKKVVHSLPAGHKLGFYLASIGASAELAEYANWLMDQPVRQVPLTKRRPRYRADLPFRRARVDGRRVPRYVYRPHWRELDPYVQVDDIGWERGKLVVTGRANIPSVDVSRRWQTSKIVLLRKAGRRLPVLVRARSFRNPEATALSEQERYNYDWSGFRFKVRPGRGAGAGAGAGKAAGRFGQPGTWQAWMLVRGRLVWRPARVHTAVPGPAERPAPRELAPGLRFGARWAGLGLNLVTWRVGATVTGYTWDDDGVSIQIDAPALAGSAASGPAVSGPAAGAPAAGSGAGESAAAGSAGGPAAAQLVLVRSQGAATWTVDANRLDNGRFSARIELDAAAAVFTSAAALASGAILAPGTVSDSGNTPTPGEWDVYLRAAAGADTAGAAAAGAGAGAAGAGKKAGPGAGRPPRIRVAWPAGLAEDRRLLGGREVVVGRNRYGDLVMAERTPRPVIDSYFWQPDGRLELRGSFLGTAADPQPAYEVLFRRIGSGDAHVLPLQLRGERFTVIADVEQMPFFGTGIALRDGEWKLYVRPAGSADELAELKYDHDAVAKVDGARVQAGRKLYRFMVTGHDDPLLVVEPKLRRTEQGNYAQRALRRGYYPVAAKAPLRDSILFVSWKGKQCGDNPAGIAAELRRRGDAREQLWVVNDWCTPVPRGGTAVLRGTREYFDALARSRWIISNDDMQLPFRKRDGQFYLQTWHGTLLKRIGFDVANPQFISGTAYFDHLARDVAQWDLLLAQNAFSTPLMRRAFRYEGEILESGYPRDDVMRAPGAAEVAASVRERLGLPAGKRVVLYVPTWRDNQVYANGKRYRFDMRLDLEQAYAALGDDYVFLVRGHHQMADDVTAAMRPGFAMNVTAYPDISELYLVSDVLITDYSSAMFDYAVTGRPMLFFTYDLADYRDNLRGFYVDFEAEVPGPLLDSSAEVIAALADIDTVAGKYTEQYQRFVTTYCPLDDGMAGARVCDKLFPG